jgi:hypothetical protein
MITKKRLEAWNGEKILKRQIRSKWMKDTIDLHTEIEHFGKAFKERPPKNIIAEKKRKVKVVRSKK